MDALSKDDKLGVIEKCRHGIVHFHIFHMGLSLHFPEEVFLNFASMVNEASSRLMDDSLAKLMGDSEGKEAE
ncbi:MAG: hypothetical protein U9R44_05680 [Candidatus Omnitrophota bacterium]|nr:hypothetical protein [Candidatus Omnitrophota bacterium]